MTSPNISVIIYLYYKHFGTVGKMSLKLMYITNDTEIALIAERNGVDRIFIDLEALGKEDRQKNMDTVKSHHTVDDVKNIAKVLSTAELLVRINPWNVNSSKEIDDVIGAGAKIVMLPMWKTKEEIENFLRAINGRAKTILLLETREAVDCLDDVLTLSGIDEIHIGLNDLHLSYRLTFMFELLANGTVEYLCKKIAEKGIPYGFGGIGRIGEGILLADLILCEHYRLRSQGVILSRSFCNVSTQKSLREIEGLFCENIMKLRALEKKFCKYSLEKFQRNQRQVTLQVEKIVEKIRG